MVPRVGVLHPWSPKLSAQGAGQISPVAKHLLDRRSPNADLSSAWHFSANWFIMPARVERRGGPTSERTSNGEETNPRDAGSCFILTG
jgi:hypothetical protein